MTYKPSPEHARILARDPGKVPELPWRQGNGYGAAEGHAICSGPFIIATVTGLGYPVGTGWSPNSYASAEYIVRAANAMPALVAALTLCRDRIALHAVHGNLDAIASANEALALAAGPSPDNAQRQDIAECIRPEWSGRNRRNT